MYISYIIAGVAATIIVTKIATIGWICSVAYRDNCIICGNKRHAINSATNSCSPTSLEGRMFLWMMKDRNFNLEIIPDNAENVAENVENSDAKKNSFTVMW